MYVCYLQFYPLINPPPSVERPKCVHNSPNQADAEVLPRPAFAAAAAMQSFPSRQHALVLFDSVAVEEQFVVVDIHRVSCDNGVPEARRPSAPQKPLVGIHRPTQFLPWRGPRLPCSSSIQQLFITPSDQHTLAAAAVYKQGRSCPSCSFRSTPSTHKT